MRTMIIALLVATAFAVTPFMDVWEELDNVTCTAQSFRDIVLRVYQSVGKVEPYFAKNVKAIKASKIAINISAYIVPCLTCDVDKQVAEILAAVKGVTLKKVWVCVEGTWNRERSVNVAFLTKYFAALSKSGITAGIQTEDRSWMRIMGRESSDFSKYALWFVRQDNNPNGGFRPFGGWRSAVAKQYAGAAELCGDTINKDSYL